MRGWLIVALLAALVVVLFPAAAWAAEGAEAAEGGKEKLDPFGKALDLGIWTLVVFLLLLFVLTRYAWKPMLQGLEQRERTIAAAVEDAQKARDETRQAQDQLRSEIAKGHERVREMIEEARKDADQLKERRKAEAEAEIVAERDRLRRELALARDQALKEMWDQSANLAALISTKAVRRQLTPDDHRQLVDEALSELRVATERRRGNGQVG